MNRRRLLMFSQKDLASLAYDKWEGLSGMPTTKTLGSNGLLYLDVSGENDSNMYPYLSEINGARDHYTSDEYNLFVVFKGDGTDNTPVKYYGNFGTGYYYSVYNETGLYGYFFYDSGDAGYGKRLNSCPKSSSLLTKRYATNPYYNIESINRSGYNIQTAVNTPTLVAAYAMKPEDLTNYLISTYG